MLSGITNPPVSFPPSFSFDACAREPAPSTRTAARTSLVLVNTIAPLRFTPRTTERWVGGRRASIRFPFRETYTLSLAAEYQEETSRPLSVAREDVRAL